MRVRQMKGHRIATMLCSAVLAAAMSPVVAVAQDSDEPAAGGGASDDGGADADRQTITQAVGVSRADGKLTAADNVGNFEATTLAVRLLGRVGQHIRDAIAPGVPATKQTIVPIIGDARLDLAAAQQVDLSLTVIEQQLSTVEQQCAAQPATDATELQSGSIDLSFAGLASAALDLLTPTTTIDDATVTLTDAMLIDAVASAPIPGRAAHWLLPQERLTVSPLQRRVTALLPRIASIRAKPCAEAEAIDTGLKAVAAQIEDLLAPGKDGEPGLFARAIALPAFDPADSLILRLTINGGGGSRVVRSNFFTLFGAEAIRINSGVNLGYRLVDPETGHILAAGTISCTNPTVGYRRIYALNPADIGDCR